MKKKKKLSEMIKTSKYKDKKNCVCRRGENKRKGSVALIPSELKM